MEKRIKAYLIVERALIVTLAIIVLFFFFRALGLNKLEIKGGPTYLVITILIWRSFVTIWDFFKDCNSAYHEKMPWHETFLFIDQKRDHWIKVNKKILFFLVPGHIVLGVMFFYTKNGFFLLLWIMHFYITVKLGMRYLKFGPL